MKRLFYRRAMMRAIDIARTDVFDSNYRASKTDGLRAIRTFERINNIDFDPFDKTHILKVSGYGHDIEFFRRAKKIISGVREV
jgi:hypothetical protein